MNKKIWETIMLLVFAFAFFRWSYLWLAKDIEDIGLGIFTLIVGVQLIYFKLDEMNKND